MSSSGDDCFPLSMVCDVCEVQMQLGYEEKKLIVTSPKET